MTKDYTAHRAIPANATAYRCKTAPGIVYVYTSKSGALCAKGFSGKRGKCDWHHSYPSQAHLEDKVTRYFQALTERQERKTREAEKAKSGRRGVEVGHVLVSTWGYDQTNVDYYQVTKLIGKTMVEIRKIGTERIEATGWASDKVMPAIDDFRGNPLRRKCVNGAVNVDDVCRAYLWDGKPDHRSSYA